MITEPKLIPFDHWSVRDLRDSLLGHLENELENLEDSLNPERGFVSGPVMTLLLPVLVDAGVLVDTDGTFYTFDMQHDHDPDNYSAPNFDLRDDSEMQHLRELLQEQIESASKDQIVR